MFKEKLKADALSSQGANDQLISYLKSSFANIEFMLDKVLRKSLFASNEIMYKKLKISLILNALNSLKIKKRLDSDLPTIIV
jgi:hypothetical protein